MLLLQANWYINLDNLYLITLLSVPLQNHTDCTCYRPVDWTCLHLTAYTMRLTDKRSRHSRVQATTLGRPLQHQVQWCISQCTTRSTPPIPLLQPATCRWRQWRSNSMPSCSRRSSSGRWWWHNSSKPPPIRLPARICTPASTLTAQGCSSMPVTRTLELGWCRTPENRLHCFWYLWLSFFFHFSIVRMSIWAQPLKFFSLNVHEQEGLIAPVNWRTEYPCECSTRNTLHFLMSMWKALCTSICLCPKKKVELVLCQLCTVRLIFALRKHMAMWICCRSDCWNYERATRFHWHLFGLPLRWGRQSEDRYHVNNFLDVRNSITREHDRRPNMYKRTQFFTKRDSITNGDPRQCSDCCCTSRFTTFLQRYLVAKRMWALKLERTAVLVFTAHLNKPQDRHAKDHERWQLHRQGSPSNDTSML